MARCNCQHFGVSLYAIFVEQLLRNMQVDPSGGRSVAAPLPVSWGSLQQLEQLASQLGQPAAVKGSTA